MSRGTIYVAILALLFALALPSLNEDGSFIVARNVHRLLTVVYRITGAGTPTVSAEQSALEMFFRGMFSVLRMDDDAHFLADFRRLADPSFPLQAQPRYIPGVDVSEILLDDGTGVRAMLIVDAAVKQSKVLGGKCVSLPRYLLHSRILSCHRNSPTLLYFHGGGFSTLSVNFFRSYLAGLSRAAAIRIVAVDYRLVPEHSIQVRRSAEN
jgi:acetyl esterase/lipase